jgi:hypothetical protein
MPIPLNNVTLPSDSSTNILDHIVHLTPPGSMEETARQFTKLGFTYVSLGLIVHHIAFSSITFQGNCWRDSHQWSECQFSSGMHSYTRGYFEKPSGYKIGILDSSGRRILRAHLIHTSSLSLPSLITRAQKTRFKSLGIQKAWLDRLRLSRERDIGPVRCLWTTNVRHNQQTCDGRRKRYDVYGRSQRWQRKA